MNGKGSKDNRVKNRKAVATSIDKIRAGKTQEDIDKEFYKKYRTTRGTLPIVIKNPADI